MKARSLTLLPVIAITLAAPAVFANSAYHSAPTEMGYTYHPEHVSSARTRAQVSAEIDAARKDGTYSFLRVGAPLPARITAPKSRQQIIDEMNNESPESKRARQAMMVN